MSQDVTFKTKYLELRTKYMNDIDVAFRLGFEQGAQQAKQQQAQDAQAQANEQNMQGMGGDMEGQGSPDEMRQPGAEASPGGSPDGSQGSELDQHIGKLESMLGSDQNQNPEVKKSLEAILTLRKAEKLAAEMKKSEKAIASIAKSLNRPSLPSTLSKNVSNMTDNAKSALSLQHKIVNDVFKTWQEEEGKAGKEIVNIINVENLIKE